SRPLDVFSLIVWRAVGDLVGGGQGLDLRLAEARPIGIGQCSERYAQSVAGGADILVHLKAALQLLWIERAEHPRKAPSLPRGGRLLVAGLSGCGLRLGRLDQ